MTMQEMINAYNTHSAAHAYALGFVHAHELYVAKLGFEELSRYFKLDRASKSHGGMLKIRIRMSASDKAELSRKAERLGAEDMLTENPKYNKGENFERILTELWTTETWVKDHVPFNVAGDLRVNGVEIQVKLDKAELTNEKMLTRIGA